MAAPADSLDFPAPRKATVREWLGLAVLAIACVVYVMDITVLHLAVPALSADLKPTGAQLLWIIDIYGFMVAGFLITMGSLGDRLGRRRLLLIGSAIFGLLSILAALSTTATMLIVSRALLGIAGATLAPSTLSLIFNMFPDPRERGVAIAVWISAFSAGSGLGPVLGGLVLAHFWWGAVFLLAVPVMMLLLLLGPFVLPEYRDAKAGRIDAPSVVLSLLCILPIVYSLKETAQNGFALVPLAALVIGLIFGYVFARRQFRLADPLIDLKLFRIPALRASLIVNVLGVFLAFGYFLFVAQYLQLVLDLTPLMAGLWSVPSAVAFIAASNLLPRVLYKANPAHVIGGSLFLAAIGLIILSNVGNREGLFAVVAASIIISFGLAPVFGLTTEMIVGAAPPEQSGVASGMAETASELGGALGISILGSIGVAFYRRAFTGEAIAHLPAASVAEAQDTLGAAVAVARALPGESGAALLTLSREAFVSGMRAVAVLCTLVAVAAALISLTILRDRKGAPAPPRE